MAVVVGHDPDRMLELGHYGLEPLSEAFTPQALAQALAGKKQLIQAALMDQTKVAGIGKIYADEACFLAGVSPLRTADSLSPEEITRLHAAIRQVLEQAINARGTSTLDAAYRDAEGRKGDFQADCMCINAPSNPAVSAARSLNIDRCKAGACIFAPQCQR